MSVYTRYPVVLEQGVEHYLMRNQEDEEYLMPVDTDPELLATLERTSRGITDENPNHLFAPFTKLDLNIRPVPVMPRDAIRMPAILEDLALVCDEEHVNHVHPFCSGCRDEYNARASLTRWLAKNPGRELPAVDDTWAPRPADDVTAKSYLSYDELARFPEPTWLIPGLVPDQTVGYLMGRDGTYKTFLALWFAMDLVHRGRPVLFIAGEGVRSFRKRIDAWLEHHQIEMTAEMKANLDIRAQTVDLFDAGSDYAQMVKRAEERRYAMIVVDTLARSSGAADQNSNSEMNLITQRVDRLKRTGATVLVVAHTDKADNGIRGASAVGDNADFRLLMKRKDEEVVLSIDKMKDDRDDFTQRLAPLAAGESIVLVPADSRPAPLVGSHTPENRILMALAQSHSLGWISQAAIRHMTAVDGSGKGEIHSGTISRIVSGLVREGIVLAHDTKKEYRLNPDSERAQKYLGVVA